VAAERSAQLYVRRNPGSGERGNGGCLGGAIPGIVNVHRCTAQKDSPPAITFKHEEASAEGTTEMGLQFHEG
jgi:hypothetical protein